MDELREGRNQLKTYSIKLSLDSSTYKVIIGQDLFSSLKNHLKISETRQAIVISDKKLKGPCHELVAGLKRAGWSVKELFVEAGENLKEIKNITPIFEKLVKLKADRRSTIFALGGGSVGDAIGFVASTYLRGVSWVGVPTTLLAQVDSSVGGKTAVNHWASKNLIGTFHQPRAVLCNIDFLSTLSKRDMISGLGEVVKYALVYDKNLFFYIKDNWQAAIAHDQKVILNLIVRSLSYKALAVEKDEFDMKGVREFLNFGHTFAHALESLTGYKTYRHGEAVILGMRFALALSFIKKKLSLKEYLTADDFLAVIFIPKMKSFNIGKIISLMFNDKKVRGGKLHFVLLSRIGKAVSDSTVTESHIKKAYKLMMSRVEKT